MSQPAAGYTKREIQEYLKEEPYMTEFQNSQTMQNLMRAFAGESQARNRYTFAADMAKQQKLPALQAVFLYTANQEKEHAEIFYNFLQEMNGKTIEIDGGYPVDLDEHTLAQLKKAAHNENEEHDVVYRSFGDIAEREGFLEIAHKFRMIGKIEKTHAERFEMFASLMETGKLFASEVETGWVCLNCGHVHYGKEAPAKCPVCSHEQGYFIRMSLAPWTNGETA